MIAAAMHRQLARAQNIVLERALADPNYARNVASHPLHACLSRVLPQGEGQSVLELGCGPGRYVAFLASLGFKVTGVDPYRFPTWDQICRAKPEVTLQDGVWAETLPFADHTFDHVVCLGALLYFTDAKKALGEIHRVTRPGGRLLLRTVNRNNLYTLRTGRKLDPASKSLFTMPELVSLVEGAGFTVRETFAYGFWPPMCTNFWWYLANVWVTARMHDVLSGWLSPERRVNNIVVAEAVRARGKGESCS